MTETGFLHGAFSVECLLLYLHFLCLSPIRCLNEEASKESSLTLVIGCFAFRLSEQSYTLLLGLSVIASEQQIFFHIPIELIFGGDFVLLKDPLTPLSSASAEYRLPPRSALAAYCTHRSNGANGSYLEFRFPALELPHCRVRNTLIRVSLCKAYMPMMDDTHLKWCNYGILHPVSSSWAAHIDSGDDTEPFSLQCFGYDSQLHYQTTAVMGLMKMYSYTTEATYHL